MSTYFFEGPTDLDYDRTTIFEFVGLSNKLTDLAHELETGDLFLRDLMLEFMGEWLEVARGEAPILTGTLRASHHLTSENLPNGMLVTITLAHFLNPLLGGWSDQYGPDYHSNVDPWMTRTASEMIAALPMLQNEIERAVLDIFRG